MSSTIDVDVAPSKHWLDDIDLSGTTDKAIARYLDRQGKLNQRDLSAAVRLSQESRESIWKTARNIGVISERDLAHAYSVVLGIPIVVMDEYPALPVVGDDELSVRFLKENKILPIHFQDEKLVVVMADPSDEFSIRSVAYACQCLVEVRVGVPSELDVAFEKIYVPTKEDEQAAEGVISADNDLDDIEHLKDMASEAPVIRLVNSVMQRAVESNASDIHLEPFDGCLKIRYRIDGVLVDVESPPASSMAAVTSRIKIMSKLNIAERRLPQDGRIKMRIQGKELDLRVSTVPTLYGESVVIRLLDKESVSFDFGRLGFDDESIETLESVLKMPHGIFLVTGPTGSGKSTTLYTALSRLNSPDRKIITVEDPVEYQLNGVNQIQVKPQIDLTFANALRAIVRQDPDIIMIGEMRDLETTRIAVQSALTGHLVLSTLHTNDAAGGVARMLDMGVDDYLITSTVNGILAQRLVRRLCPNCKEPHATLPEMAKDIGFSQLGLDAEVVLYKAVGCKDCAGTGYRGRLCLTEILVMNDDIRRCIMQHANAAEIKDVAIQHGMETMYKNGLRKVMSGVTTLEEVIRVTDEV
jgi:general secretion pathway protein E